MVKNKCARLILAAFELKKLNANTSAKKTFLRAMEADDAEELIDGLNEAEEDIIDDTDKVEADSDVVVDDETTDEIDDVDASDEDDDEEMSDEEVVEEVEAKVRQLKASNRVKAKAKMLRAKNLKAKAFRKFL